MQYIHSKRTEGPKKKKPHHRRSLPHVVQTYAAPTDGELRDATSCNNPNAAGRKVNDYRMFPVCPSEKRPGCGHTVRPCGPRPTLMRWVSVPVAVSNTYTSPS